MNLLKSCIGPVETYYSHCGKYSSTLDYIFLPNCLFDNILMDKTFDLEFDNTSDHAPIQLNVSKVQLHNVFIGYNSIQTRFKFAQ